MDSVGQGAISSYTFNNVTANHTISATFTTMPTYTITASAGSNGTISPSGAVVVNPGSNKTFTITPNTGYQVSQVTVDSVGQGAITTYTFNNITANHTISATFSQKVNTITASAATGGTITPSGAVQVNYGANQSFTIGANANYAISSVNVDGVDVGAVTSYTFNSVVAAHTISAVFIAGARNIPAADRASVQHRHQGYSGQWRYHFLALAVADGKLADQHSNSHGGDSWDRSLGTEPLRRRRRLHGGPV